MIVVLKRDISKSELEQLRHKLQQAGCEFQLFEDGESILRIKNRQSWLSIDFFLSQPGVQNAYRITPSYDLSARKSPDHASVIRMGTTQIGPAPIHDHRRTMRGGIRRTNRDNCTNSFPQRRKILARRRIQTADFSLCISRTRGRRTPNDAQGSRSI